MLKTCAAALALTTSLHVIADERPYPAVECVMQLERDTRLSGLAGKVALGHSKDTTAGMLTLDRPATPGERTALALWSNLRQDCFARGELHRRYAAEPEQAALAARLFNIHQRLLGDLQGGRMTFAEFNTRRFELYAVASRQEREILESSAQRDVDTPPRPQLTYTEI